MSLKSGTKKKKGEKNMTKKNNEKKDLSMED
jgi:hypothetical protein